MPDLPGVPRDRSARPSLEEVLRLRADRRGTVRRVLADLTDERLAETTEPVPEPGRERDTAAAMSGDAWWTYCVLDANQADSVPADLSGVEPGTTIEIIRDGKFAALISRVPLAEYEDDRLREHMNDIGWVERTARAHEAVASLQLSAITTVR